MRTHIETLFQQAGCDGQLCVQSLDGAQEIAVHADQQVVSASVFKVLVALEAETQFADVRLNPRERVLLPAASRTPGPAGFSLDDAETSLRDLVVAMLTISDNVATDALLDRVGIDAVNATAAKLGLHGTVVTTGLRALVDSIGQDAGFADWAAVTAWTAGPHSEAAEDEVGRRVRNAIALTPGRTNRTTPRDMVTLLRLIWSGQAGPAPACARIREIMGRQLTRHRLAAGFPPPARVAAKSGGLVGIVRNEIGVIEYPDGRGYAAAVFTQAHPSSQGEAAINAVIGAAAAAAVSELAARRG